MAVKDINKLKLIQHVLICEDCTVNMDVYVATSCEHGLILASHLKAHYMHVLEDSHTHVESA